MDRAVRMDVCACDTCRGGSGAREPAQCGCGRLAAPRAGFCLSAISAVYLGCISARLLRLATVRVEQPKNVVRLARRNVRLARALLPDQEGLFIDQRLFIDDAPMRGRAEADKGGTRAPGAA